MRIWNKVASILIAMVTTMENGYRTNEVDMDFMNSHLKLQRIMFSSALNSSLQNKRHKRFLFCKSQHKVVYSFS